MVERQDRAPPFGCPLMGQSGARFGTVPAARTRDVPLDTAMNLREVVEKYLAAGAYGRAVALSSLGLSTEQLESVLSLFDEDYHISRYFHLQCAAGANYNINGFPQTHVSIDAEIQTIL